MDYDEILLTSELQKSDNKEQKLLEIVCENKKSFSNDFSFYMLYVSLEEFVKTKNIENHRKVLMFLSKNVIKDAHPGLLSTYFQISLKDGINLDDIISYTISNIDHIESETQMRIMHFLMEDINISNFNATLKTCREHFNSEYSFFFDILIFISSDKHDDKENVYKNILKEITVFLNKELEKNKFDGHSKLWSNHRRKSAFTDYILQDDDCVSKDQNSALMGNLNENRICFLPIKRIVEAIDALTSDPDFLPEIVIIVFLVYTESKSTLLKYFETRKLANEQIQAFLTCEYHPLLYKHHDLFLEILNSNFTANNESVDRKACFLYLTTPMFDDIKKMPNNIQKYVEDNCIELIIELFSKNMDLPPDNIKYRKKEVNILDSRYGITEQNNMLEQDIESAVDPALDENKNISSASLNTIKIPAEYNYSINDENNAMRNGTNTNTLDSIICRKTDLCNIDSSKIEIQTVNHGKDIKKYGCTKLENNRSKDKTNDQSSGNNNLKSSQDLSKKTDRLERFKATKINLKNNLYKIDTGEENTAKVESTSAETCKKRDLFTDNSKKIASASTKKNGLDDLQGLCLDTNNTKKTNYEYVVKWMQLENILKIKYHNYIESKLCLFFEDVHKHEYSYEMLSIPLSICNLVCENDLSSRKALKFIFDQLLYVDSDDWRVRCVIFEIFRKIFGKYRMMDLYIEKARKERELKKINLEIELAKKELLDYYSDSIHAYASNCTSDIIIQTEQKLDDMCVALTKYYDIIEQNYLIDEKDIHMYNQNNINVLAASLWEELDEIKSESEQRFQIRLLNSIISATHDFYSNKLQNGNILYYFLDYYSRKKYDDTQKDEYMEFLVFIKLIVKNMNLRKKCFRKILKRLGDLFYVFKEKTINITMEMIRKDRFYAHYLLFYDDKKHEIFPLKKIYYELVITKEFQN